MGNALFVVWRESVEAMLVVGILYAWLKRNDAGGRGIRALWLGVGAGIGLALALGWAMLTAQSELSGQALDGFQIAILFIAAGLITQMVLWMARHGREMKQNLERNLARATERANWFGVAAIAALAIAREGAETVIFLYGLGLEQGAAASLAVGALSGFALAALTAWAAARGLRFLDYRTFFRISGFLLLLFAAALLVAGVERLIGLGVLPPLIEPLWDSSALLDDATAAGRMIAGLTGYRAQPSLTLLVVYVAYWGGVTLLKTRRQHHG
jgi:high-affinity iron transporter